MLSGFGVKACRVKSGVRIATEPTVRTIKMLLTTVNNNLKQSGIKT